ncbi:MAG: NUDIX hydrolase [Christensenellaceae bacterium]|jgi:coenzyme A diphosphatase NUDT7
MFKKLAGRQPKILEHAHYKKYAVIAPYLPDTGELLFEVRAAHLPHQPGETCFPGGRIEQGEVPEQAAVRETTEELLVDAGQIEVVAPLDYLVSPFYTIVYPFVANLHSYTGTFSKDEVGEVFTVPFRFFLETPPEVHLNHIQAFPDEPDEVHSLLDVDEYPWMNAKSPVLFYRYRNKMIWGMTAKFVHNIVELYRSANK